MLSTHDRAALLAQLTEGIGSLTTSTAWHRYLDVQSRFHRYSFHNVLLIAAQCPEARRVAGFGAWRKLHRSVRRGERAIWVVAPMVARRPGTGPDEDRSVISGFKLVPVFDIGQTDGAPLPAVCHRLEGDPPAALYSRLVEVAGNLGFAVVDHSFAAGTNGDCSHALRRIRVESAVSQAQRVKTLAHELAHAVLHEEVDDLARAELEAESAAYVVCRALGIDSGCYSFGYVASWAGGGAPAVAGIKASGDRIHAAARAVLGPLDSMAGPPLARPAMPTSI